MVDFYTRKHWFNGCPTLSCAEALHKWHFNARHLYVVCWSAPQRRWLSIPITKVGERLTNSPPHAYVRYWEERDILALVAHPEPDRRAAVLETRAKACG